jgi:GxxExxY protein
MKVACSLQIRSECSSSMPLDFVVENALIVEIKSVEHIEPIHVPQILTYLRLTGSRQALLVNFNVTSLRAGVRSYLGRGSSFPRVE